MARGLDAYLSTSPTVGFCFTRRVPRPVSETRNDPGGSGLNPKIQAIHEAELEVRRSLGRIAERLDQARDTSVAEMAGETTVREFEAMRKEAAAALARYEHELALFRSLLIQQLVDEQGLTLTEVGHRLDISRQMVARLYRAGKGQSNPPK